MSVGLRGLVLVVVLVVFGFNVGVAQARIIYLPCAYKGSFVLDTDGMDYESLLDAFFDIPDERSAMAILEELKIRSEYKELSGKDKNLAVMYGDIRLSRQSKNQLEGASKNVQESKPAGLSKSQNGMRPRAIAASRREEAKSEAGKTVPADSVVPAGHVRIVVDGCEIEIEDLRLVRQEIDAKVKASRRFFDDEY